jgi:hypothetical protein
LVLQLAQLISNAHSRSPALTYRTDAVFQSVSGGQGLSRRTVVRVCGSQSCRQCSMLVDVQCSLLKKYQSDSTALFVSGAVTVGPAAAPVASKSSWFLAVAWVILRQNLAQWCMLVLGAQHMQVIMHVANRVQVPGLLSNLVMLARSLFCCCCCCCCRAAL